MSHTGSGLDTHHSKEQNCVRASLVSNRQLVTLSLTKRQIVEHRSSIVVNPRKEEIKWHYQLSR